MKSIESRLVEECNKYFERNRHVFQDEKEASQGTYFAADFLRRIQMIYPNSINKMLEIGCSYGYNLDYLYRELCVGRGELYGVDPSDKAIEYGRSKMSEENKIYLFQACSNELPFPDEMFDVVIVGFCLYITPRDWIEGSINEIDRVLNHEGFLVVTDFDVPFWIRRNNMHNASMPVYKEDYAQRFLSRGYSLVEKRSYSHNADCFSKDIQERVSTQILFKENTESLYISVL